MSKPTGTSRRAACAPLFIVLLTAACGGSSDHARTAAMAGNVDDERIVRAAEAEPGSWLTYGQTYKEQRFSTLDEITRDNVAGLKLAWSRPIGGPSERMQGTPLVVDGVMYATNGWGVIHALDPATGEEFWTHDPQTDRTYVKYSCCGGVANRGVAVYRGKVYVALFDGRLVAVDAATGEGVWDVDTWHPSALGRFNITGAPRAAAGKVFIGQGSSESGKRRGYVSAYDAETGELAWRFYLVPGDPSKPFEHPEMEMAAKTWGGEWWKMGGGGTAWNSLVHDHELNLLYIGVGNGAPWSRQIRSPGGGDDLFLTAIVAVDADTAEMKWYYQTVPGDNWDYSSAMDIALGELTIDGVERKVLLQAPKNGFFYVIDRETGELLRTHPYTDRIDWATHVDMESGRPVENPDVVFEEKPQWITPANAGAHNWEPMSWDEDRGIMYFYYHDYANFYALPEEFVETGAYTIREWGLSLGVATGAYRQKLQEQTGPRPEDRGFLVAFDPLSGDKAWEIRLPSAFNGGVLATASGLLFHGGGGGDFNAYDKDTGEKLWEFDAYGSFSSSIISYMEGDVQYVATMVGGSTRYDRPGELLVFSLDGEAALAEPPARDHSIPDQPPLVADAATIERGNTLYHEHCALCHRGLGQSSIVATASPDLRRMSPDVHDGFTAIVQDGLLPLGMPGYAEVFDEEATTAIHQFIISKALESKALEARGEQ